MGSLQILFSARAAGATLPVNAAALVVKAVELEIASIAPGGEGLAHVVHGDRRRAVFVPRAAPGDVVQAEVDWTHKPARARVLKISRASPVRTEPPCPLASNCGGCDLMHISLVAQIEAHRDIVRSALAHAVAPDTPEDPAWPVVTTHAAPRAEGYRTRARLALTAV